jgi:hypothetical protein
MGICGSAYLVGNDFAVLFWATRKGDKIFRFLPENARFFRCVVAQTMDYWGLYP